MKGALSKREGASNVRRLSWAVGLVLLVVAVAAVAYRWKRSEDLARAARVAVASGDVARAREAIGRWLAADPGSGEAYYLKARMEIAANDPKDAIVSIDRALEKGYPRPPLETLRAILQARANNFDVAEPVLARALRESAEPQPEVAEALARGYLSTFRLPQAAAAIRRWMRDAPEDPRPYLARNEIDTRSDADRSVLIKNYQAALARDPKLDAARLGLAEQLRLAHRYPEADVEYRAYLERRPNDPEGHLGAGRLALETGKLDDAVRHLDRAIELAPDDAEAHRERALLELRRGDYTGARDRLKRVIELDPFDPEVRYSYARALKLTGDDEAARAETATAGRLRVEHSRMAEIRAALVRKPKDVELRYEAARWLLEHGHEAEAIDWTGLILRDRPSHAPTHQMLADYYQKKGNAGLANYHRLQLEQAKAAAP